MRNLNFDNGLRNIYVNGDKTRVLRWNAKDPTNLDMISTLINYAEKEFIDDMDNLGLIPKEEGEPVSIKDYKSGAITELSDKIAKMINDSFGSQAYDVLFEGVSPLAVNSEGTFLFLDFMMVISEYIAEEMGKVDNKYVNAKRNSNNNRNRNNRNNNKNKNNKK